VTVVVSWFEVADASFVLLPRSCVIVWRVSVASERAEADPFMSFWLAMILSTMLLILSRLFFRKASSLSSTFCVIALTAFLVSCSLPEQSCNSAAKACSERYTVGLLVLTCYICPGFLETFCIGQSVLSRHHPVVDLCQTRFSWSAHLL
jgi:hypothetical protein